MNANCQSGNCVFERLTEKTTEYDFLLDLFDNYDEIEIYRKIVKHNYNETNILIEAETFGYTEAETNELRKEHQKRYDGSVYTQTTIFLSQYSIDGDSLKPVFFGDEEGIRIIIFPKEELSEDQIIRKLTIRDNDSVEVNLSENLKANMRSVGGAKIFLVAHTQILF